MLPPEAIQEFKRIYNRVFGEELTDAEAAEKAMRTFELHRVIFDYLAEEFEKEVKQDEPTSLNK